MSRPRRSISDIRLFHSRRVMISNPPANVGSATGRVAYAAVLLLLISGCTDGVETGYGSRAPALSQERQRYVGAFGFV